MAAEFFDWNKSFDKVNRLFMHEFGKPSLSKIKECLPEKLDWFISLYPGMFDSEASCLQAIQRCIMSNYSGIRFYHSCRPNSVLSYYKNGLICLSKDFIRNQFFKIIKINFTEAEIEKVSSAIDSAFLELEKINHRRRNHVYIYQDIFGFPFDDNDFLSGSEIHRMIFSRLMDDGDLYAKINEFFIEMSVPTIFIIDVPFEMIDSKHIELICRDVISKWAVLNFFKHGEREYRLEFAYNFSSGINAKYIVKHRHPRNHCAFNGGKSFWCDKCKKCISRRPDLK